MEFSHKSVLLNECIEGLNIKNDGVYVDGTLGGAGHSLEICKRLSENGMLIGIDQDINAIQKAKAVLSGQACKLEFANCNFSNVNEVIASVELMGKKVDGFLLDLGVSSHQLDEASRGFSYMQDAPLDMRMDVRQSMSAYTVVNEYDEEELFKIIKDYGEERFAKRIARFISEERRKKPIETTLELVAVIKRAIPASNRQDGPHPAKRTFQAIRIEVNSELSILEKAINNMVNLLNNGGRICIITFHSLEDRIVKNTFKSLTDPCTCPSQLPVCVCGKKPSLRLVTKKPILPSEEELLENHRSRSAKLRVAEKV